MNKKKCFLLSLIMMLTFVLIACSNNEEVFSENSSSDTITETQTDTKNDASEDILEENIAPQYYEKDGVHIGAQATTVDITYNNKTYKFTLKAPLVVNKDNKGGY